LGEVLLVILIILGVLIVGFCLAKTSHRKKKRIITGMVLLLSVFTYPLLVPFFGEFGGLDGVVSLIAFYLILLIGGVITLIAGFFTKSPPRSVDSLSNK
jgi:ABC-type glycerol-3-phosphate transport system permease component